ncbi:hypothetical protein ACJIZ3_016140 [Penstemon smallii]|uniref:F-box domain-containing protein n=1 Tax=Penstemon smallii TaxID=265156 RepID=A0ABD3RPI6_9LAMI
MDIRINFVDCFQSDVANDIFKFLDDAADLIRATAVSRSWRHTVIANGLCKKLCLRKFPPFASIACVVEENEGIIKILDVLSKSPVNWGTLERQHNIYCSLLRVLATPMTPPRECIAVAVGASSTDRDPAENVVNTLIPVDRYSDWGGSYWSSAGHSDPNVPEHILYRLRTGICILTEINIRPFEVFFVARLVFWEPGSPVYSAKCVRFKLGHPKSAADFYIDVRTLQKPCVDKYVWTYTSPEFPMTQESCMQQFKLPEPVVCIGGLLLVELLGRVQKEEINGLFYICLGHVRALGRPLGPAFNLEMFPSGELLLRYCPDAIDSVLQSFPGEGTNNSLGFVDIARGLHQIGEVLPFHLAEEVFH